MKSLEKQWLGIKRQPRRQLKNYLKTMIYTGARAIVSCGTPGGVL
jgi:hypothetical protein